MELVGIVLIIFFGEIQRMGRATLEKERWQMPACYMSLQILSSQRQNENLEIEEVFLTRNLMMKTLILEMVGEKMQKVNVSFCQQEKEKLN